MKPSKFILLVLAAALLVSAQDKGTIAGTVFDASTGQPVRGAAISIDGQSGSHFKTDTEGRFRFDISPGKYKIVFSAENFTDAVVDEVIVAAGQVAEASTVMANKSSVTKVDVVEKVGAVAANAEAMLTERRLASVVSDGMSSDEIKKTVASDAAGAVEKVTGVSVVDSGYVYVRGLGERYSSTMLNNAMIPTT
ncbi:MAG: carboxypeptidase regulatory-like domain-containing protein, partial [Bryobacterales bacterium]|nr:carboxypeptidase regulatory-like domain-containing protein [Bryobacterales bacterium]